MDLLKTLIHQASMTQQRFPLGIKVGFPIPPYFFDVDGHNNQGEIEQVVAPKEKELVATTQKKAWEKHFIYMFVRHKKRVIPIPDTHVSLQHVTSSPSISPIIPCDDSHPPIIVKKGVRSCTQHPIANHVSYDSLSPEFKAFSTSLSSVSIPCCVS